MWGIVSLILFYHTHFLSAHSFPLLLLVSFDGFRHDYPILHGPLKNFQRLQERGVHAPSMIPSFATMTFPNHYTIVTGLYEEVHGFISNHMFDPKTNLTFEPTGNQSNSNWWPYPSIWSFNEQRKGARSGVSSWPQEPLRASKSQIFSRKRPFRDIIDQMLQWFTDPIEPINFGAMYFFEPDLTGHRVGPYSEKMTEMVRECDQHLGYLLDKIDENENLRDHLHLIVVSDHGMEQVNGTTKPTYIEDYIDRTKVKAYGAPTLMNIFVEPKSEIDNVMKNLSRIPHTQCYKRQDISDYFHYKNHEHIGDIILLSEPGYEVHHDPMYGGTKHNLGFTHGNHGYDHRLNSMHAIFYASGPQFKRNFTLDSTSSLYNVDLFGLMCLILKIDECPPSNGSLENIRPFLVYPSRIDRLYKKSYLKIASLAVFSIALIAVTVIIITAMLWSGVSLRTLLVKKHAERNEYQFSAVDNQKQISAVEIE